jgi:hypothetical protein
MVILGRSFRFRRQKHILASAKKQQRRNECQNLKGTIMKNRNTTIRLAIILSMVACFGLLPGAQAVEPAASDTALAGGNTSDGQLALGGLTTGIYNSAFGIYSLLSNDAANFNTGMGAGTLLSNTASENTAIGAGALLSNTIGARNAASGAFALFDNTEGNDNTATGDRALLGNTTGSGNTAYGSFALGANTTGGLNTAVGAVTLPNNTIGNENTGIGLNALFSNTEGNNNTAVGRAAMGGNTIGGNNTAVGWFALEQGGVLNTAVGSQALRSNTGGLSTAVGDQALFSSTTGGPFGVQANTGVGDSALFDCTTGYWNVAVGYSAGHDLVDGHGNVYIGQGVGAAAASENDTTYIRNVYDSVASARAVFINSDNKIGTMASSRRYKEDITPMDKASEALFALKPVTFRYKKEIDRSGALSFGLIAEEVAEISLDLITRDRDGKPETVRYEAVNAMMLNEFLKEHKKVEELHVTVAQQQNGMEVLTAQLKEQAAQIQKVSAQLEVSKPAPQVVLSNP